MSDMAYITDKSSVRASFERAAQAYDAAAVLQAEVASRMAERLAYIRFEPKVILDAGSGTGSATPLLKKRYPDARIIELDLAHAMLRASRDKQRQQQSVLERMWRRGVPWQACADIEALPLQTASVDMIWSSLALQWVPTPDHSFAEFKRILRPGGMLMFATFGPDTLSELRQAFSGLDTASHVNQFIDMHDLGDALVAVGLSEPVMDMEKIVLTYPTVRAVLQDLKAIGAHNVTQGRRRGLMGKTLWQAFEARYQAMSREGRLPATYEVIYGHAWHHQDKNRLLPDGRQVIEFVNRR